MTTYGDLTIGSLDQVFIDNLSEEFDIDYYQAEVYLENVSSASITNQLIYYIYEQAINNLNISNKSKERLQENIYTNCLDSFIKGDVKDYPKKERKEIEKLF